MSVEISDALARDLLWWIQNTSVPYVTVGERWGHQGGNRKEPAMGIARDSMVEELSGAMAHPDAMKDDFDDTLDKQLSDMARACGQVYHQVNHKVKKVELTVNQAKELATKLKNNAEFFFLQTGEFDYDTDELWQCLTEKIEQAEMSTVSTQCENVSKKDEKIITLTVEQAEKTNA